MKKFLLLGAGFSRNWGGWLGAEAFEYLLGRREVQEDPILTETLWKHQDEGNGFEYALAEIQTALDARDPVTEGRLLALQRSTSAMFDDMNSGFERLGNLYFR